MKTASMLCLFLLLATPAFADAKPESLALIGTGIVTDVAKPDSIHLDDGKTYRLANLRFPSDQMASALEDLRQLALHKKFNLYSEGKPDRYGTPLVHLVREDKIWIQKDLIAKGMAWAFSTEDSRKMMPALLPAEQKVRAQHLGLWAQHPLQTPDNVSIHSFQVVQGKILEVAVKPDYTYLNFGADWKTDFTITIPKAARQLFEKAGLDPAQWKGQVIRIRGWVEKRNGPMITLTHPEQIELLRK